MTTSIVLGRAASCLEQFAGGLCLTLLAAAFLNAATLQVEASMEPPAPAIAEA